MMPATRIADRCGDGERVERIEARLCALRNLRPHDSLRTAAASVIVAVLCLLSGCKSAEVTGEHSFTAAPAQKPKVIYVMDFDLGAQNIQHQEGILPLGQAGPGLVRGILSGETKDPVARARQLT